MSDFRKVKGMRHVVTAQNVTDGSIAFACPVINPINADVTVKTSAGAAKAWDGAVVVGDGVITVDNSGGTDWAATDVISIITF